MKLRDAKTACWLIVMLNGVAGPIVKLGFGYENVPYLLVWPRMWFAFGIGAFLAGLYLGEHLTQKDEWDRRRTRSRV
jgi:hypothetical protein